MSDLMMGLRIWIFLFDGNRCYHELFALLFFSLSIVMSLCNLYLSEGTRCTPRYV